MKPQAFGRALLLCALSLAGPARGDTLAKGLALATAGIVAVGEVMDVAPSHEDGGALMLEGGRFDVLKDASHRTASNQLGIEYRSGSHLVWKLKPLLGAAATTTSSVYAYGGLRLDTYWGPRIVVAPSLSLTAYERGNGKDLGSPPLLGRFGIDVQYVVNERVRLGVGLHHMSNGQVLGQDHNPGTGVAGVTLAVALP